MVGWYHQLTRCEFEQTQGDSEGQRNLVCYSPWGYKELDDICLSLSDFSILFFLMILSIELFS